MRRVQRQDSTSRPAAGDRSVRVSDKVLIDRLLADPGFPFLVSFPRTGSHWLRMLAELYFERPSLVRSFYYHDRRDYLMFHTHDLDLSVERANVIYLYRDPVETIFSQLRYEKENPEDHGRVAHWADLYGRHLDKWLYAERFTARKTVLTYEGMQEDLPGEFRKLARHYDVTFDSAKLEQAVSQVTRDEVKRKTGHDPLVVQLGGEYARARSHFAERQGPLVWEALLNTRLRLEPFFPRRTAA